MLLTGAVMARGAEPVVPAPPPTRIAVHHYFRENDPGETMTAQLIDLMRADPGIQVEAWGGISLPGGFGRSSLMMAFAGNTAPDIMLTFFHGIRADIAQGFLQPLNEWIGDDLDGNGQVDLNEAKWDGWAKIPPLWRMVATVKGKVYALPVPDLVYVGIIFRKDLVIAAGLDPEQPPGTWDEFLYWGQRLTFPNKEVPGAELSRGQRGYFLTPISWLWLPWEQSAGGSPLVQTRRSPTTGRPYTFAMEAETFRTPDTGEDLSRVEPEWAAAFGSPAGIAAARFYQRLAWAPWLINPADGKPVNLTEEDVTRGVVTHEGREIRFAPADVIRGVVRTTSGGGGQWMDQFARGEVAMMQWFDRDLQTMAQKVGVPPEMLGMFPVPAMDATHKPSFQVQRHYVAMTSAAGARSKVDRDRMWTCLTAMTSAEARDREIRRKALLGGAMWCHPADLERLGLREYLDEVPPALKRYYAMADRGDIRLGTEPFAGFWEGSASLLENSVLSLIFAPQGRDFDCDAALRQVDREANSGVMFAAPREQLDRRRPLARVIFGIGVMVLLVCVTLIIRERFAPPAGSTRAVAGRIVPWLMLGPALLSIGVWSYYPLLRGSIMAFQDYRILGSSTWVGLDNFIAVATDPNTWLYAGKTVKFVAITLAFGFITPIVLAVLLSEIPRGKVLYRTLFFLPQMTSGLVVTLMWGMMYNPTENGVFNRLLSLLHLQPQAWLQDPFWAMFCCVLPGVWASAGVGSLIYIAALKAFPDDFYEAAAIDGAGLISRFRHITLPQLMPLIVINFVGAFIGACQSMGSIFLLTFGGPGKETTVLGLAIWKLAYNDLRFSSATTLAWFMGTALIAFTYLQIRFLRRVEFRRAEEN
jgi:multiple sugar transport system permease protein